MIRLQLDGPPIPMNIALQASSRRSSPHCPGRKPAIPTHPGHPQSMPRNIRQPRPSRHRHLRCDCGQLAITERLVRVGSDPQYTIRLPLCPACLKLEQELHG